MTKSLMLVTLSFSGLAMLAACGSSQTAPREIGSVDSAMISDQATVDAQLKQRSIVYDSGRQAYGSDQMFEPCDQSLLNALKDAEAKTAAIDEKLQPQALRYRGDALDFSRKIASQHVSLSEINNALSAYCGGDYPQQVKCVADPKFLSVRINEAVAGAGLIHPFIRLSPKKATQIFIYSGEQTIRSSENSSPYPFIAELVSPAQLKSLAECFGNSMTTELGQSYATTAQVAEADMSSNCADLQQKNKTKGLRSNSKAENEFCGIKE